MEITVSFKDSSSEPTHENETVVVKVLLAGFHVGYATVRSVRGVDENLTWQVIGGAI
jgi:hypothetical protein